MGSTLSFLFAGTNCQGLAAGCLLQEVWLHQPEWAPLQTHHTLHPKAHLPEASHGAPTRTGLEPSSGPCCGTQGVTMWLQHMPGQEPGLLGLPWWQMRILLPMQEAWV